MTDTLTSPRRFQPVTPRLSRRAGFCAIPVAFAVVTAFSTAPSGLYGAYETRDQISSLTITFVYGVYAVGVIASLLLAGHISDWYGRRAVLLPAIGCAIVAAVLFLTWKSVAGLFVARVFTGVAIGATLPTATAFITDLDPGSRGAPTRRAAIVSTVANIGGLALGPVIAGVLARYAARPLTLTYDCFLVALVVAAALVAISPEGHPAEEPLPEYRPQLPSLPLNARRRFAAATAGVFLCFAVFGLYAGLAGSFLAGPLHHPSSALAGLTIFLAFGSGVLVQTTTMHLPAHRLLMWGIAPAILGLGLLVVSAWLSPPSLALFLISVVITGASGGAIFRGSLTLVIGTSNDDDRAGILATFFTAGYLGLSVPVVGLGIALQHLSHRAALLIFAVVVCAGILAAAPLLVRPPDATEGDTAIDPSARRRA